MLIIPFIQRYTRMLPVVMLVLTLSETRAQEVIIRADLDTNRALIGDQLRLSLNIEKPVDVSIEFPVLRDTITRKIEIVSESYSDTASLPQDRVAYGRDLLITAFDTGFFEIPAFNFIAHKGLSHDTVRTLPVYFEIVAVKSDSTLHDIKSNYRAPLSMGEIYAYMKEYYPYGLIALGLGLLIWLVVRQIRKRLGRGKATIRETVMELPEVIALRELEHLKAEKPWMHNKAKLYHTRLSEILRNYVEGRFHIMALEQTTEEILQDLKTSWCPVPHHNRLAGILKLADLVKFAKVIPAEEENAAQIDLAAEFVRATSSRNESIPAEENQQESIMEDKITSGNV